MTKFSFSTPNSLEIYIDSGQPLNIIDELTDQTLLIYVCDQILNSNPNNYQLWVNIALKILDFPPDQILLNYANRDGITALILVSGVDVDVSLKILENNENEININSVEKDNGMNALMYACTEDTEDVALKMLEFPSIIISIKHINKNGYTPLMIACEENINEIALTMIDQFPTEALHIFQKNNSGKTAFDLALDNDLVEVYRILDQLMREIEINDNLYENDEDEEKKQIVWGHVDMPMVPDLPENDKVIDMRKEGYDPILLENKNIAVFINEDDDNIVISYENKEFLLSKSIINQQLQEGIVFECLHAEGNKDTSKIVKNLPLFNLKIIGIDVPTDKIGIWPEFIYLDGIANILNSEHKYYHVIPLLDKILVSVISFNELRKIEIEIESNGVTRIGPGYGSLHCQNGQGGLAGVIVPAKANISGGKKKKRKTMKRKTMKRHKKTNKKQIKSKSKSKNNNKKNI
jgi:hypothetical protein